MTSSLFGKRILLLVPHPDDEIVASSAALARARKEGAEVYALYLTNGCIARETLWPWQRKKHESFVARRRREAEAVAAFLTIKPVGWADTRPARHLWRDMVAVDHEVRAAISAHHIDQLWVPAYEGGNADHDALNALAQKYQPHLSVLEFAEYNFADGRTHSQEFPQLNGTEITLVLTEEEQATKREALSLYVSEQMNLNYVKALNECYRPLFKGYDYSRPPHQGTLWYARFQWVPFRHPRVDFTDPKDVARAITSFLDATTSGLPAPATQSSLAQR